MKDGRVLSDQALVSDEAATHLHPSGFDPSRCGNCGGEGWVCENHPDEPAHGGCCGGAGAPCPVCNPRMANAALIAERGKWKRLTSGLVGQFDFAGCTCTFQDDKCCFYSEAEDELAIAMAPDRAANGDLPVPQDCQARAEGIARKAGQ